MTEREPSGSEELFKAINDFLKRERRSQPDSTAETDQERQASLPDRRSRIAAERGLNTLKGLRKNLAAEPGPERLAYIGEYVVSKVPMVGTVFGLGVGGAVAAGLMIATGANVLYVASIPFLAAILGYGVGKALSKGIRKIFKL